MAVWRERFNGDDPLARGMVNLVPGMIAYSYQLEQRSLYDIGQPVYHFE